MGSSTSYFLAFLLGAAIPSACVVVLLPSLCSRAGVGVIPAQQLARNATQATDRGVNELVTLPATPPEDDDLPGLLRRAAMEEGSTVIMTFTNEAWTAPGSLLDLFLESFRIGVNTQPLLKHLIIVAVDTKAFELCRHVHPLCYSLDVGGGGGGMNLTTEQAFMSKDYLEMMWSRNKFQTRVLELGFGFIFTDVDIVWFRNPLLRIPVGADIAISSDQFYGEDPYDMNKNANGGLVYARPIARTMAFFKGWYEARTAYAGMNEQAVFDKVKYDLSLRHGVSVHFVDTAYFGGFCHPKKDFRQLCTFHGNCLPGLRIKLDRLRGVLDEWKQFKITGKQGDQNNSTRK
ncbi:uncharacterized protein At4g15970 isoform X2 [Brachypodium distachyon]|uniref:Nucleotide-diphospho-sugar transferase domain-containing protein n=1 Tax=Brachypodium distachyon TaxID=15368 RepID=A0A2K2CSB1_BRADI|nr:uncharacterized protein At4g15970 isoform X2 [Brachypodium distachyon]PNT64893.1 hypothetical protein BRADI_4g34590v3 [Brachypodium distachyon]|eukprot:XP_003576716.1 uncharacterized protein At4g15970 isoform X2 [Brachypodium distachyon]